jgi:uncharacterized protein
MKLKSSFYNVFFSDKNKYYVYNTLSVSIIQLEYDVYENLIKNKISYLKQDIIDGLIEEGMIVDDDDNEQIKYLYFYNRTRFGGGSRLFSMTILPTYQCNLACPYCLEGQNKSSGSMSDEQVNAVLKFVKNEILTSKQHGVPISKINAKLYGGEPLVNKQVSKKFIAEMNLIAEQFDLEIASFMTSNFTLIDDDDVKFMKKYNIHSQVTIDGTKQEHDERRVTKAGAGTYDLILSNIKKLKEIKETISIRINIDSDNLYSAENILKEMLNYSPDVYFGLLEKYTGLNDDFSDKCISMSLDNRERMVIKLNEIMRKYDCVVPEEFGKLAPCALNMDNKWFVDCYMDVYKCELAVSHPELAVGKLTLEGEFIPNSKFYKQVMHSPEFDKKCMNCKFLPLCAGGCAAKAYLGEGKNDGNLDLHYCMCSEAGLVDYLKDYVLRIQS